MISSKQYKEILKVKKAWQSGDVGAGCGVVADEINLLIGMSIPRTTVLDWLGRKGSNA